MASLWTLFAAIVAVSVGHVNANCQFRHTALLAKHPLLLDDNSHTDVRRLMPVDSSSYINLKKDENVTLVCPGTYNYLSGGNTQPLQIITASCNSGYNFVVDGRTISLNLISCYSEPNHDVHIGTPDACGPNTIFIEVGFNIPGPSAFFLKLYELCFDQASLNPVNIGHYVVSGGRAARTATMSAFLFPQVEPPKAYERTSQTESFTTQLGSDGAKRYITTTNYLEAKLLVPKEDFVYGSAQLSAYYYFNSFPAWKPFLTSYWTTLEQSIRTLATTEGDLRVFTSTRGIAQLTDDKGVNKPVYLHANKEERYMPLPDYLVKSVTNSENQQVIFLEIAHRGSVARSLAAEPVCAEDVCAQLRWLSWRDVPFAQRPSITCCRPDDALLRRRLPDAFGRSARASSSLLVGRAPAHYYA